MTPLSLPVHVRKFWLFKVVGIDFLVEWLRFLMFEKVTEVMMMIEMTFKNVYMNFNWKA